MEGPIAPTKLNGFWMTFATLKPEVPGLWKQGHITNERDYSRYTCYHVNVRTKHLSAERLRELSDEIEQKSRYISGATWRVMKKYPLFFAKMAPRWLAQKPRELLNMMRLLSKKD